MTRQSAAHLRKLNGHLVHLALEVEAKVNHSRGNQNLNVMSDQPNQQARKIGAS